VSLTERLFGRPAGVKLDLAAVQARLADSVRRAGDADPDLTRARLADGCRDAAVAPALPEEFDAAVKGLDGEGWRRLAVLVGTLDLTPVRAALPQLPAGRSGAEAVAAFAGVARGTPLLTIEVLEQSELRVEELARRLLAEFGAAVAGETADESKKKLHRLDYGRLLAEAEQARQAAAERAERLKKLQDEQEQRRSRRGKH
jgi:hypothetical protein